MSRVTGAVTRRAQGQRSRRGSGGLASAARRAPCSSEPARSSSPSWNSPSCTSWRRYAQCVLPPVSALPLGQRLTVSNIASRSTDHIDMGDCDFDVLEVLSEAFASGHAIDL